MVFDKAGNNGSSDFLKKVFVSSIFIEIIFSFDSILAFEKVIDSVFVLILRLLLLSTGVIAVTLTLE